MEWREYEREADESAQRESEEWEGGVLGGRDLCERIRDRKEVAGIGLAVINNIPW